ncbi:hypothetical protein B7P43_G02340 [Cryptotermes secundus]|uniref:VWFD domain-containing protein n=7 Tax=Cryptotermes secundus TaxID=105785 RepID=A0A2J7PT42_9NEOP|nr:hypothetical protein B7P43_G02340 [Cryptotermes secundus]
MKKINTVSNFWGWTMGAHLWSTVPAIANISFDLDFRSRTDEQLTIKTLAVLNYNTKESALEANWKSDKSSLFGDIQLHSHIQHLEFVKYTLKFIESSVETSGSLEMNWASQNKIFAEFFFKKVDGAAGTFRITTPFTGYKITAAEYNFTNFQDDNGITHLRMKADALFKEYLAMIDISGSKSNSSLGGILQLKTPFTEEVKIDVLHQIENGKLNEKLLVSLAEEDLLFLYLVGEVCSFSNVQLSAGLQMPNQNMNIRVETYLSPGSLEFNCRGEWNTKSISTVAVGRYENTDDILSIHLDMTADSSLLSQNVKLAFHHASSQGTFQTTLHLPGDIILTNVFIIHDSLNWKNKLDFKSPSKTGFIENKQSFVDGVRLEHEMIANLNGQQATGLVTFIKDPQSFVIREAKAVLNVPWTDPIIILYLFPNDEFHIRPSLVFQFRHTKEIRIEIDLEYQLLHSRLQMEITSAFYKPILVNASYSIAKQKLTGQILTQWDNKKIHIESNLNFEFDMMKTSGDFFVRHSDMDTDAANGSFDYNMTGPEITAHALGTYRNQKLGFGLSLLLGRNVYKGSITVQTPFQNWENLSFSCHINISKPVHLAVITLSRNHEDITVSGLIRSDIYSSKFNVAMTSHILGFHSTSVYGAYSAPNSSDHSIELAYDNNDKRIEILAKLQVDNDSFLNAIMAEGSLKTPFKGYETMLAHYSYNTKGNEKKLDLQLVKSSWKFVIESECSFGSGIVNGKVKVELPFEELKEMSFSLRYGYTPSTLERTVNIAVSRNLDVVEMAGALLINKDGSLMADAMLKSPVSGYKQVKFNVAVSASKEKKKSVTVTFSRDQEDYMISGTFTFNTEARLVIITPLKGYENIEARIGYIRHDEDHLNSTINERLYGYLDMATGKSELNIDLNLKEMNSIISANIISPLLMVPHIEIKGEYDLRMFPGSVSFIVNKDAIKVVSIQIILERNRFMGEIITPIEKYTDINLFASFRNEEEKKHMNFKMKLGEHSFQLLSTTVFGAFNSKILAEVVTTVPGIDRITLHGQYDLLHDEKTAELVITLDPSNTYELFISGTADSKIGQFKVQVYTPVSEFESVFLAAKYDLTKDCYMNILVEKNDIKNYFGGHVAFTDDGTLIRIETPFKHAEDISFHYTYHAGNNERSENLIVVRNGHLTILESSFKYENNVAVINLTTQLETVYGFLITLDFNGMPVEGKEYALSISVLKNSQPLLKASSHILIDCSKEIYAKFELNTPLLPNNFEHLSFNLCFTPVFPPPKILMTVLKNEIPILDLRSDFGQKLSGFTYDLKFMSGHVQRLLSIDFSPGEKNVKFNIDSIADTPEQYIGDLRFNKATGTLSAIFTSPIVGFDKFSFQWKQGHDSIDTEIITPFKGYENLSLAAHFKVKHIRKSAMLFISKNDDTIGFSMSTDHADGSDELALYAVTPFTVLKKFDVQTQYIKSETKKIVRLNVTVSNQHFKIGGELLSKENILQAKLDISSSLQDLEQINSNFFYDITESLTFGGKLDIGDISTNISGTIDFDFLQGELLGSLNRHGQLKERRFMWSLENTHLMKTAKIAVNLGYELNFVIDAILNISNLKNVKAQVSFIKPVHIHQLYPYTSTYKLQWNIRNVMAFDGGLFIMLNNVPYCNLNLNVDLDNATEVKILNAHYLGFSYNYRIHLTYQLMNNNSIELLSKINLGGTELIISLNFMLNNTKFITRCGEFHFSLGYNLTTKRKILDIEYQISQNIYRLSSNLTFHKPYLPVVSITLNTPVRHYSFLHLSNQYIMNTTHKGFKILLQKEERNGEISLSMWKNRNNIGLKGNMSLPFKDLKTWYGIGNLDMTSGLEGNVNCSWDSTKHLALNFRYAPDSLKANINTPFTGLENINAEFLLNRKDIMEILISVNWGDKKIFLNGSGGLDNGNKPEFIIFFLSPWADPFTLSGKYENRVNPVVTILLQRGSELARLEGQIEYSITDLKFVMKFSSELNGHKMTIKTGYDFEYQTKKIYFEARFVSLSFIINGALNSEGMDGRLYVKTPFSFFQEIAADGILTIGQSATFKLRWNDKLYILNGEYEHTHGHLGCKFTLLSPYVRVENIKFDIKYDYESAYLKLEIPIEALYLDCSYHFQTYVYSVGATLKVPSVTLLKRLSFAATLDTANLTASAIGQWSASQIVNISASLLPSNQFIKVETPFEGFEKILILGSLKNESTHLAFAGKLEVGNDNSIHVHHIIGYGFMQHSITINMPVLDKMNFNVILQFDDPRNMSTKLTFGPTTTESTFSAEGMLDLKDMFGQFNVHHPFMEGNLVCKTLWDVKANLQIKTSTILKVKGSYTLSRNDIIVKWNTQTSHSQSFTALGGSYEYDHKSELKTKLFFNEDIITSYYKINSTSMTVNFKLNSPALLKIKDFSLDIEGSHSPNLHGSFSYKYNTQSVFVTVILSKTQETVTAQGIAHVQPLLGPVHHMVQIAYNVKDPQNFFQCKYEGNIIHKALMSYKNDDRVFKVTLDVNSEILGTHKILMLLEKNGQFVQLEIMNMFSVSLKAKQNEGHLIVRASGMEHEAFYQLTYENGFHGSLTLVSPLISNGKINVTAAAKCDIENIFADLKYVAGMKSYHVTFEINSTEERTSVKVEVISLLKTILSLNAYIVVNRYDIQAETLFEFFETVSSAMLRHRRALPLNTELNIMSPYFPKKVVKFVLNTENNSITLYGGHGDKSYGEYIMLEGTINHNDCMAYLNFIAPKLPLAQYINISGIFRPSAGGKYDLEFSTQFSSEILITEFSAKFHISSAGLDTAIKFVPPWEDMENYGAKILIPFSLSNNMKPCIALHLGKNNTYALHGKFVYLKDIQEIGFGAQYKLRKLGASLKTENAPIPGIQFEIDIPLGDNVGHYGVNVKNQKGKNLLGIASALNYTHIGVEWDSNLIELRYTLSDISIDAEERLDINTSLKCTLLLELTTPFSGYEQNGLKMYVNMSSSYNLIVISINYPGSSKPFGFELNYQLKAYNDVSLVSQLHIPFIPALEDVALMLSNKFEEKDGRFRSVLGGHWNKEELAITLEGNLKEEIVFKGTMTLKLIGQTFTLEANYGTSKRDTLGLFVMRVQLTSPLTVLKNAEVYVEINVMRSVLASITYNSKELLGFHIYSDEVLHFGAEIRNQWRSAYFVCSYDTSKDIIIQAELAWDMNQLSRSQFVVVFAMTYGPDDRQEMSVILKLPSRVLKFNFTQQLSPVHTEYAGSLSWTKHNIIGFKTLLHINASSDVVALLTMGRIDLPHRSFELGSYASARLDHDTVIYADIRTEFLWDALEDRNKKIGIALRHYSSILEIVLQHVAMRNDLVVRIEKHGRLSYNHLPFAVKIEVEYSTLPENLITMEAHVQYLTNTAVGLNMGFSLHHVATSIDFKIGAEIAQTLKENIGRMSAEYLNSYTGQKHIIEFMGKMSLLHPEMKISVRTAENRLEVHGLLQTDNSGHYAALVDFIMNQKEPLHMRANIFLAEPRAELEARYGDHCSYKMYAGVPHCREVTFGVKHVLYGVEHQDAMIMLRLNSSQQLWSRIRWQPRALTELKTSILQEYSDVSHVVQSIGSGFSEAWLKDFAYKSNIVYPVLVDMFDQIVSTSMIEAGEIYMDFLDMGEELKRMYRRNDFYLQDIQPYVSKLTSYFTEKASGICKLLLDGTESMYLAVTNFVVMVVNTFEIDLSHVFSILDDIKVVAGKTVMFVVNCIAEIKRLHTSSKEYLKTKIEATRLQIMHVEENMKHLLTYVENYLADLLASYIQLLEPYLTSIENTLELLSRRVIDFEDKISVYILDMVDTVLGAEEVQELVMVYNKYSSWLEELHLQDYIDQVAELFEGIGELIMQDIQRVFGSYLEYVKYITDAMNNVYSNINAMPLIAYSKHAMNIAHEKAKWVWQHYRLNENIKAQVHSWIENLDKILLRLLNAIDMDARSPTKSLTPNITLHPDIGLIEYSQKLPIEWNCFNELPKFEQLQLYEQLKDHANEVASLEKYRYYLMNTFYDITNNISLTSAIPPFSAYGMVIGNHHYITYDKKFYNFTGAGECSYLLANDFLHNRFSAFVTYKIENMEAVKKSLSVLVEGHHIEINSNRRVEVDGLCVDLPVAVDSQTWIKRTGERILVHSELGIEVECNFLYDICIIELSGWYFGKTGGMLGTFDYEPSNDLTFPNGTAAHTIEAFANSWHVGSARCHSVNHATLPINLPTSEESQTLDSNQCTAYFEDQLSPLRRCFSRVETGPFYQMCLSELAKNTGVCTSVAAYVSQCRRAGVDIWIPQKCVHCPTLNGSTMNTSQLEVYDGVEAMLADVVFVVEQSSCIKKINLAELVSKLDTAMNLQGLNTRFSVVGFNGNKFSEPYTHTSGGEIWASLKGTEKVLRSLQTATSKSSSSGNQRTFSAMQYVSRLPFRATASKTIVLLQCTLCQETEDEYSHMISMLLENDITLHILQPHALKLHSGQGKASKVYGVDLNGAFSGRNLKNLMPSFPLLRQVVLPKDLCVPLAFETNGTFFNMDHLLHKGKGAHRLHIKKFIDVWARRVTLTATPSQCQTCRCIANQDGMGQIMCSKCVSPSIEHFLKNWGNLSIGNQRTKVRVADYVEYPA